MKANLQGLMVHFDTKGSSVLLPIMAIQAVEACDAASSYIYLKAEYRYDDMSFLRVLEPCDEIVNIINQTIIDANRQITEEV